MMAAMTALLLTATNADAVFTFTNLNSKSQVTLRVGSANGTVNTVTFDVSNANVSPTPVPVTGIPGNGSPATSPANGTEIQLTARIPKNQLKTIQLTVDSSAGLSCVGGSGCGTTVIPFSAVRWTSYNKETGLLAGNDIQDGVFTAGGGQLLARGVISTVGSGTGLEVVMSNVLIFQYDNATLYPAGQYTGRVIYTATNV